MKFVSWKVEFLTYELMNFETYPYGGVSFDTKTPLCVQAELDNSQNFRKI